MGKVVTFLVVKRECKGSTFFSLIFHSAFGFLLSLSTDLDGVLSLFVEEDHTTLPESLAEGLEEVGASSEKAEASLCRTLPAFLVGAKLLVEIEDPGVAGHGTAAAAVPTGCLGPVPLATNLQDAPGLALTQRVV